MTPKVQTSPRVVCSGNSGPCQTKVPATASSLSSRGLYSCSFCCVQTPFPNEIRKKFRLLPDINFLILAHIEKKKIGTYEIGEDDGRIARRSAKISPTGSAFQKDVFRLDIPMQNIRPFFVDRRRIILVIRIDAEMQVRKDASQGAENVPQERFRDIFVRMEFIIVVLVIADIAIHQILKVPSIAVFNIQLSDPLRTSRYAAVDESHDVGVFQHLQYLDFPEDHSPAPSTEGDSFEDAPLTSSFAVELFDPKDPFVEAAGRAEFFDDRVARDYVAEIDSSSSSREPVLIHKAGYGSEGTSRRCSRAIVVIRWRHLMILRRKWVSRIVSLAGSHGHRQCFMIGVTLIVAIGKVF